MNNYNPLVDEDVRKEWKLRAHMNFGATLSPAGEKGFLSDDERFIIAK